MPLSAGTRLGPYEIVSLLGTGGMGEVYEARDDRLNRMVALKVLPVEVVADAERRQRFVQEAQLASALQHPHIVTIFDIGTAEGSEYLAMELVKGRTLDRLIPQKGLRLQDALRYAIQITDALAAAHAAGIVHRDLKPGNIMVTDQGQVKILDFGLATLTESAPPTAADETRAQAAVVQTGAGTILGTVAYMSPEQAEGHRVDARSDLFSFGAILYEMLTGQRAFRANSTPGTLAAVINLDPPQLTKVADDIPPAVEQLVSRCLRKDPARRAQHASDIKVALEDLREDSTSGSLQAPVPAPRARRVSPALLIGGLVVALAIVGAVAIWKPAASAPAPAAFVAVPLTSQPGSETCASFSPDGSQVAYAWLREGAVSSDVYVQIIGGSGTPLRLSDDGHSHFCPAWAPDGKSVALWHVPPGTTNSPNVAVASARLVIVSPLGGPERQVLEWTGAARRLSWSPDSKWIAASPAGLRVNQDQGITLVSPATGERIDWVAIDKSYAGSVEPVFSPDGRRMAFAKQRDDFSADLYLASIAPDGKPAGPPTLLSYGGKEPVWARWARFPVWTADGTHILLIDGSASSNGGVVRVPIDNPQLAERIAGLEYATSLAISRDGTRLVIGRGGADIDIWRGDLRDPAASGPVARSTLHEEGADYSPDGRRIAFSSNRQGAREIWVADITGENALALTHFGGPVPGTARWSPDGKTIAFDARPDGNSDVFIVPSSGGPVQQLTEHPDDDGRPAWSADGRWIYFSSARSGRSEIWRMAADGSDPVQLSKTGGLWIAPARTGDWVYYTETAPSFRVHQMRSDGSDDSIVLDQGIRMIATSNAGLWVTGLPKPGESVTLQFLRFADSSIRSVAKLDFLPAVVGMSVSPDERYVLVTRPDASGTDLMLVSDFR